MEGGLKILRAYAGLLVDATMIALFACWRFEQNGNGGANADNNKSWPTSLIVSDYSRIDGTLENGYVRNLPLPRIPRIQSTSQVASALTSRESHVTCYLRIAWIPTWSKLSCLPEGFGTIPIVPFFPLVG